LRALAPHGEKIVMHISNFRKVKRVDDVVRIFAGIRQEVESRLVFVGDGPERASVTELASRLGVLEDIVFLGKLESVAGLLSCADLFLLPSEQESFGLVALEALASGVPVVGTGGSGLAEVVDHGVTGYLHPVGAVEAMAASSVQLLTDADLWSSFGRAARDAAVRRYSAALIVPMYERFYQEVLEGSSR
ncbi:MAG: glycosyltransferase, partial [Gemmatimonadetes bacterium]|nr:glycosyltransferase [Gemmatimonadota bacterium]